MVEIIVALGILATSMLAVFGVLSMCTAASGASQRLTESVLLAEALLAETMLQDEVTYATTTGNAGRFSWEVRTAPAGMDNLAVVRVKVHWLNQQKPQEYELYSLMHIPTAAEGE